MKTIIMNFAICLIACGGLTLKAQNTGQDLRDSPLIGLWIFEKNLMDNNGNKITVYPGTFMMIEPGGHFTFFLYTQQGGFIVNEGDIILESDSVYIEKIEYNLDSSYIGKSLIQGFKIENGRLSKTLLDEMGKGKQETEIWKKVERPINSK